MPLSLNTVSQWVSYIESLHPETIDMGLRRFNEVLARLPVPHSKAKIITVSGTNGKGSTCTFMESILLAANYRVGCYLSPHLIRFNERIRINGEDVSDDQLMTAFLALENARQDTALTFFEFSTLTAWLLFHQHALDAIILEVGLGGRLDAVNAFDTDCAIITSVSLDHTDYLGDTIDLIGKEKAGIFRPNKPAVLGIVPDTVIEAAENVAANVCLYGVDFGYDEKDGVTSRQFDWWKLADDQEKIYHYALPIPNIGGDRRLKNACLAMAALDVLSDYLPISLQNIRTGLSTARLLGRLQQIAVKPAIFFDAAHNAAASQSLAKATIKKKQPDQQIFVLLGLLSDKDAEAIIQPFIKQVDYWYVTSLPSPRTQDSGKLADIIEKLGGQVAGRFDDVDVAWHQLLSNVSDNDKIIAFGSFVLVGRLLSLPNYGLESLPKNRAPEQKMVEHTIKIDKLLERR